MKFNKKLVVFLLVIYVYDSNSAKNNVNENCSIETTNQEDNVYSANIKNITIINHDDEYFNLIPKQNSYRKYIMIKPDVITINSTEYLKDYLKDTSGSQVSIVPEKIILNKCSNSELCLKSSQKRVPIKAVQIKYTFQLTYHIAKKTEHIIVLDISHTECKCIPKSEKIPEIIIENEDLNNNISSISPNKSLIVNNSINENFTNNNATESNKFTGVVDTKLDNNCYKTGFIMSVIVNVVLIVIIAIGYILLYKRRAQNHDAANTSSFYDDEIKGLVENI